MKTILVPTDFSKSATNAARYALHIAKALKASITLCNAIKVPADAHMAAQVVWPLVDYATLKEQTTNDLKLLSEKLAHEDEAISKYHSERVNIDMISFGGEMIDVVNKLVVDQKASLVVMGMVGASALSQLLLGSNTRDIIKKGTYPVLLVPPNAVYQPIQKIAFATTLDTAEIELIHSLASFATYFNAEILIAHITDEEYEFGEEKRRAEAFLSEISGKADYSKIYYRHVKSSSVEQGLSWLNEHGIIDMLVMVHHKPGFFQRLFEGSHTQKMARHTQIPLLMLPSVLPPLHF